jgi:hypothetical protein
MMRRWYEQAGFKFCTVAVVCVPGTVSFSGWACQTSADTDSSHLYYDTANSMGKSVVSQFDTYSVPYFPALDNVKVHQCVNKSPLLDNILNEVKSA